MQDKGSGRPITSEETVEHVSKEIVTKNKSGNPDSTNSSLAQIEEALDSETLQLVQAIAAEDKRGCILNMCEIGYKKYTYHRIFHSNLEE